MRVIVRPREQARLFAEAPRTVELAAVYASPLELARQTATAGRSGSWSRTLHCECEEVYNG